MGTAGFTAMLAVMALEAHEVTPAKGPVLVTGAAGGVGSVAIALLAKLGYTVIASTGRPEEEAYLKSLGASEIVARARSFRRPESRSAASAGPAPSTRPAATHSPMPWRRPNMAARSRLAAWRRAWTCPPASPPSSCAA